ncbi:MAG: hypothetical protein J6S38_03175 [Erysipelotrichaceae bacterium]|nr:hypothetical protein [Erysipelotrichaceae bacterium]MBP5279350.1 hypothetical protein [Erysipelotrichaceae bacterium]
MKEPVKCYRCGKEYDLSGKNLKEIISCSHCHQTMRISERSQKRFKVIRYLFVLILCMILAFGMSFATQGTLLILIAVMSLAMLVANYSDRLCLRLTDMIFGLEYEEYHEKQYTKKEIRKQKANKKKGLFR